MHARNIPLLLLTALLLIPLIRADSGAAPALLARATANNPFADLKQGLSAEVVKKILGEPIQTRPMKAPNGKAEVWVYEQELSRRVDRIDASTPDVVINVTQPDGSVKQQVTPGHVRFQDVHYLMVDMIEVLMFNDHYLMHKVTRLERKL